MKRLLILGLLVLTIWPAYAQNNVAFRKAVSERLVPADIKNKFNKQYPGVLVLSWYATHVSYWYDDYGPNWYADWYGPRKIVVYTFDKPAYYEVEFIPDPGEISRSIYNRYGNWFETRTEIQGLPPRISDALNQTQYRDWKWSQHKERIEAPGMKGSVYRLQVSQGRRSRIIRVDDDGDIVQVKERAD